MKKKKRPAHHYFFSHAGNGYKPHLLSEVSVAVLVLIIVGVFGLTALEGNLIGKNANLAAVYSDTLVELANQDWAASDLSALTVSPLLTAAASAKADDMVANDYFAHYSPTGISPWYWIAKTGYDFVYAGENLAIDFTDSDAVNAAWLASPEHRANILNVHYTQIGIATAEGMYQGQETTFVVEMFGTPVAGSSADIVASSIGQTAPQEQVAPQTTPQAPQHALKVVPIAGNQSTPAAVPIAVENAAVLGAQTIQTSQTNSQATSVATPRSSAQNHAQNTVDPILQVATNPGALAGFIYLILGLLILIPLLSIIISGIRAHNIKHIAYGVGLIGLMVVLFIIGAHIASTVVIL